MLGKRLPRRPLALERGDGAGLRCGQFGNEIIFTSVGLEVFMQQLHPLQQPAGTCGAGAVLLPLELGDLQLEMGDHRLGRALAGTLRPQARSMIITDVRWAAAISSTIVASANPGSAISAPPASLAVSDSLRRQV